MDKDYSKLYLNIFLIILALSFVVIFKNLCHKREINKLLGIQANDYIISEETGYVANSNDGIKNQKKDKNNITLLSDKKSNDSSSDKQIGNSSKNTTKKVKEGNDFISNNLAIEDEEKLSTNKFFNTNSTDTELLARLIESEAGDEPYLGKLAVGNVVLYRTKQNSSSIEEAIYTKGQFDGIHTDNFNIRPSEECIQAATEVLNGKEILEDGYFFVNLNVASPSWAKTDNFITRIGDHWFFRRE